MRFNESPQIYETDQQEMGADEDDPQGHDQQDQQEHKNTTSKLLSQVGHMHKSPINRKRKPEEEEEQE